MIEESCGDMGGKKMTKWPKNESHSHIFPQKYHLEGFPSYWTPGLPLSRGGLPFYTFSRPWHIGFGI